MNYRIITITWSEICDYTMVIVAVCNRIQSGPVHSAMEAL
jgi:hypothetical protein